MSPIPAWCYSMCQARTSSPYHEGEFKVVTVKGTFFHRKSQSMEDGNEYLKNKIVTCHASVPRQILEVENV